MIVIINVINVFGGNICKMFNYTTLSNIYLMEFIS